MAKNSRVSRIGQAPKKPITIWTFPLNRKDMYFILGGVGVILLGYLLMFTGVTEEAAAVNGTWNNVFAVVISPLLLVIGYCVIIPMAILKLFSQSKKSAHSESNSN